MSEQPHMQPSEDEKPTLEAREVSPFGKGRAGKWLENFWYHYKFHTIAALILIATVTICLVQCLTRDPKPDFIICYAGEESLHPTTSNTILEDMKSSLKAPAESATEDDDILFQINHYFIAEDSPEPSVANLSRENKIILKDELDTASSFIFLMDEAVYREFSTTGTDKTPYMRKVSGFLPAGNTSIRVTEDGYGVYLASCALYKLPGFCELPEDTILSLRSEFSAMAVDRDARSYREYEAFFRACLALG